MTIQSISEESILFPINMHHFLKLNVDHNSIVNGGYIDKSKVIATYSN